MPSPPNPYAPPEEPSAPPHNPESTKQMIVVVAIAGGGVLLRWVMEMVRVPFAEWWSPPLIGALIGGVAARAVKLEPGRQWPLFALVVTAVSLGIGALLPIPEGSIRLLYGTPHLFALVIAWGTVTRVQRVADRIESSMIRDADQRALFARELAPLARSSALARFACAGCGTLVAESDLSLVDGERRCESCLD